MIETAEINGKTFVIKGIGKMFYQEGFPIGMLVKKLKEERNQIVSIFHIADELLKNGWSADRVVLTLTHEFNDSSAPIDIPSLKRFCNSNYDQQREMIFEYLFANDHDVAGNFLVDLIKQ